MKPPLDKQAQIIQMLREPSTIEIQGGKVIDYQELVSEPEQPRENPLPKVEGPKKSASFLISPSNNHSERSDFKSMIHQSMEKV